MTYDFQNIKFLQVDITSYCNSFCGICSRNIEGGEVNPNLKLNHLSLDNWNKIITRDNLKFIQAISFNGNFGDIGMHPDSIEFLSRIYQIKPEISIDIHTNGGSRTEEFWKDLGQFLTNFKYHNITFSVDGIRENASRYRRGTDFDKVMHHAKAVIETGANVTWRYIVFDHNINDIEEAKSMALDMGFSAFKVNRSNKLEIKMKQYKEFPADFITAPNHHTVNDIAKKVNFRKQGVRFFNPKVHVQDNKPNTVCPWNNQGEIQIDYVGKLWPCCYISMSPVLKKKSDSELHDLFLKYGDFNDTSKYSIEEILRHDFFKKDLPTAWNNNSYEVCNKCIGKTIVQNI